MKPLHQRVLQELTKGLVPDLRKSFRFSELLRTLNLQPAELDQVLIELENERYISQYVIESNDEFGIIFHATAFQ